MESSNKLKIGCNSNEVVNPNDNKCIGHSEWSK